MALNVAVKDFGPFVLTTGAIAAVVTSLTGCPQPTPPIPPIIDEDDEKDKNGNGGEQQPTKSELELYPNGENLQGYLDTATFSEENFIERHLFAK